MPWNERSASREHQWFEEEILIIAKTYPNPSKKYIETSCIAGIARGLRGLVRLYPVPFRLLPSDRRFRKYQWIRARVKKAEDDPRPESFRIDCDSLCPTEEGIPTTREWALRKHLLTPHLVPSVEDLRRSQRTAGQSLGLIRVKALKGLEITPASPEWSPEQLAKLKLQQGRLWQGTLPPQLEKVPFDFHYHFVCEGEACKGHKMKILDWEIYQLYRHCQSRYGTQWERHFRGKLEEEFSTQKELWLLLGTVFKHPTSWIIAGLIYPPRTAGDQLVLF
ncbi:MAG: hypothetical protein ACP5UM_07235 [Anaerolineae bacterium]